MFDSVSLGGLLWRLRRLVLGSPEAAVLYECRRCGEASPAVRHTCPACGAADVARYEL